jgi:hypothetical protein
MIVMDGMRYGREKIFDAGIYRCCYVAGLPSPWRPRVETSPEQHRRPPANASTRRRSPKRFRVIGVPRP